MDEAIARTENMLLSSRLFRSKPQMKRLLSYLIEHTYHNRGKSLQQRAIATNCLGRSDAFDSVKDPIVRIEAARLRKLLEAYYDGIDAQQTPLRIHLPKGSYRLVFSRNIEHRQSCGFSLLLLCQSPMIANDNELNLMSNIRQGLSYRLNHFDHLNLMVNFHPEHEVAQRGSIHFLAEEQYDYVMRLEVVQDKRQDFMVSSIVVHRLSQEILWSHSTRLPQSATNDGLDEFYLKLISPLVADSYGVLGSHWAKMYLEMGLAYVEDQHMTAVQFISLCNNPNRAACEMFLEYLDNRLKKYPDDLNAQGSYLAIGFFDYFLNYNLLETRLEDRLAHCLLVGKYAPHDAGIAVLTGFYYFALNQYEKAVIYLNNARQLNPYNTMWDFIYGSLLFFMGKKEEGFQIISGLSRYNETPPGYYHVPIFFYYLGEKEWHKAFNAGSKVAFSDSLELLVKAVACLGVGAKNQAEEILSNLQASGNKGAGFAWVEQSILRNYPDLVQHFHLMMKRLSSDS
ncbi:MAG: hypothetical protein ACPG47_04995 [Leucothrix sp.]